MAILRPWRDDKGTSRIDLLGLEKGYVLKYNLHLGLHLIAIWLTL